MEPTMALSLDPPSGSEQRATLTLDLKNTGTKDEDQFYAGFQRWWIEVRLPEGSKLLSADQPASADPEAPNGGSYAVGVQPGETVHLTITFSMPPSDQLMFRRQPGVTPASVRVVAPTCTTPWTASLTTDRLVDLTALCR
jgi:hypothetical protein